MKRQFIKTADGSSSIYLEEMDEHYHSKHGAIAESEHIFVKNGLLSKRTVNSIDIFEVGMGTGLNVMTSLKATNTYNLNVNYSAIEAFPIKLEELKHINFDSELEMDASLFDKIHTSKWNEPIEFFPNFFLTKYFVKMQELDLQKDLFDIIYFDAFAPEKQPEMWTEEIFERLFDSLKEEGILVTYCVKGEIRRRLQKIGFTIEKLPGPLGGKREMCRATKPKLKNY